MRLLIIEDDSYMLQLYQRLFELEGFQVKTANDGLEALSVLKSSSELPDLVLLDIMMPNMDGFQFLVERNKLDKIKDLPVIVLTNLFAQEDRVKAMELGAKDFLVKSEQDPKDLVSKVKNEFNFKK